MIPADPKNAIVRKQVNSVTFGFYMDEDVRARSVIEITSPQAFDALGTPLPRGLYDPHLGPYEQVGGPPFCITCACPYATCPGHAGVIELCVPLYHPILFPFLVKLLRAKCLACHKFRLDSMPMDILKCKYYLASAGRLQEALELDQLLAQQHKSKLASSESTSRADRVVSEASYSEAMQAILLEKQESNIRTGTTNNGTRSKETSYEREFKRHLFKSFLSASLGAKKCPHCGAFSPKIRQVESNKIFQAKLAPSNARINAAEGITIEPALGKHSPNQNHEDNDDDNDDDDDDDDDEQEKEKSKEREQSNNSARDKFMHALEVEAQVRRTWEADPTLCHYLFGGRPEDGYRVFFLRAIPVPPSRFRPPMKVGSMAVENSQNLYLNQLLVGNDKIRSLMADGEEARAVSTWIEMQTTLNIHFDSSKDPRAGGSSNSGIRQILEKKEGIFRKHMMGKRVDYCCRSVISPDPYVGTDEIGIPLHFAKTLTFPTPVSNWNIVEMRELIRRGPEHYPGAVWVQFADGRRVDLAKMDETKREGIAARLLTLLKRGGVPPIVGRQLRNGDMVLVNRQPTLHKPGIMAHYVRVLHSKTQKTIRMHYANCNTYNADFDGDEMNCHFPQSYVAAAESKYIAATDLQFIVPTDGSPLRGLIQDHVDAGVKMTCKDTFLEKWAYQQLLFNALASLPGLEVIRKDQEIELMPPAIMKPKQLWTGKQVISTLLHHLRKGNDRDDVVGRTPEMPGVSVERKSKLSAAGFGEEQEEHLVVIRDGELLRGILDKASFGDAEFSLVHAVYEAYGPYKAGLLLNALGRLFTSYLQNYSSHSCRMEDLLLTKEADDERRMLIQRAYNIGSRSAKAWADSEGGKVPIESVLDTDGADQPLKPIEAASASAKIGKLLSGAEGRFNFAQLDAYMQSQLNPLASDIIKACLPKGLAVPFPTNTFSLMVTTGAKGSIVNQSQITCALGQQALEGRRVPRLSSGRTLPSFAPYDPSPRADGFILDRFLTGIRPQEYYFHCMAGREGLVDTAVKTSRSGYLQRCLVKHLEELKVCYDSTVRNGEGGVVQFLYGEDGLDPTKCAYLDCESTTFQFIARNHKSLSRRNKALPDSTIFVADKDCRRVDAVRTGDSNLLEEGSFIKARRLRVGSRWVRGALCVGWFDAKITRRNDDDTFNIQYVHDRKVIENVPLEVNLGRCGGRRTPAVSSICTLIKPAIPDPVLSGNQRDDGTHLLGSSGKCVSERVAKATVDAITCDEGVKTAMNANDVSIEGMSTLVACKYAAAICQPGEAVGCIAAQSLGEPSTQMTLNTFHLAGAGANVTLGIPRLREIIMSASRNLKTPTMSVPLNDDVSDRQALKMMRYFSKLTLMELVASQHGIIVNEALIQGDGGNWERAYYVTLKFHHAERIREAFGLTLGDIAGVIAMSFGPKISDIMKKELRRSNQDGDVASFEVRGGQVSDYMEDGEDSKGLTKKLSDNDEGPDELDEDDEDDRAEDVAEDEDGVTARRLGRTDEVEGYDDDDEAKEVASGDEESEAETEEGDQSNDDSIGQEEEQGVKAVPNLSDQPKVDNQNNCIHLPALRVDPAARPLLMVGLVERAATTTLVRSRPKIDQGFVNEEEGRGRCLQTAGVNFSEIWRLENVDHNRLISNDIWEIRNAYGVEAARSNIVEQIKAVFRPYGISVDYRHLSLIADYMTIDGGYKAMNRGGMADISSPFLQMSFETTANFMTEAALHGRVERLMSPSANIVVGRPIRHGTGAFDLLSV